MKNQLNSDRYVLFCFELSLLNKVRLGSAHLYSAPQPLTKLMRMVHILVSW